MTQIEIITIGNELLEGDVLDTNSSWLCQRLTAMGGRVRRVTLLRDEISAIGAEIRAALARKPDLLLTSGGLGPTDDDLTLQAIAEGLDRPRREDPRALLLLQQRYDQLVAAGRLPAAVITPARRKMALLPQGAEPLPNPVGTAPAVLLEQGTTWIICLPGVPAELQAIYGQIVAERLAERFGHGSFDRWVAHTDGGDESTLAPVLRPVIAAHPDVYIKSHARRLEPGQPHGLRISLSLAGRDDEQVERGLQEALADLTAALAAAGIRIDRIDRAGNRGATL